MHCFGFENIDFTQSDLKDQSSQCKQLFEY